MSKERDYLINPEPYIEIEPLDKLIGLPDIFILDNGNLYSLPELSEVGDGYFIVRDWNTGNTKKLYKNKIQTLIVPEVLESLFTDLKVIHRLERIGPSIFRYKSGT